MKAPINSILINGQPFEYGWANILVLINNVILKTITAIEYHEMPFMENLLGVGNQPMSRGVGNYTYSGSLTIRKSELIGLQASARALGDPAGSLSTILPFPIIVQYSRPDLTGFVIDQINDVQFLDVSAVNAQGDTSLNITIPLLFSSITWNL